jgi:hypothetical protein
MALLSAGAFMVFNPISLELESDVDLALFSMIFVLLFLFHLLLWNAFWEHHSDRAYPFALVVAVMTMFLAPGKMDMVGYGFAFLWQLTIWLTLIGWAMGGDGNRSSHETR